MSEPETHHSELIIRSSILRDNIKGDILSRRIIQFLDYCNSISQRVHPPTARAFDRIKRLSELEFQIKAVWKLKTEEILNDQKKRRAFALVLWKGLQTLIKFCIDIMMSILIEVEPNLQYWRNYSRYPRTVVHRCLIYNYIEPKHLGKRILLPQMVDSNVSYLKSIRTQLIHQAGKFLRVFWKLRSVNDFPDRDEEGHGQFEGLLKEIYWLLNIEQTDPLDMSINLDITGLLSLLLETVSNAKLFFTHIDRGVQERKKPHHVYRYFFLYAAGCWGSFTCSALGLGINIVMKKLLRHCWSWVNKLVLKYVSCPARCFIHSITWPKKHDSSAMDCEQSYLEDMMKNYKNEGKSSWEYLRESQLDKASIDSVIKACSQDYIDARMSMPRLVEASLIWMQAEKLTESETSRRMDEIIGVQEWIIFMLSLLPASVIAYSVISHIKRLYHGHSLDKLSYKSRFRGIILNLHSLSLSLKDPPSRQADKTVGKVLLSCEKLKRLIYLASNSSACNQNPEDNKLLEEELRLFLDFDYDMNQRLRHLARMDRFYL